MEVLTDEQRNDFLDAVNPGIGNKLKKDVIKSIEHSLTGDDYKLCLKLTDNSEIVLSGQLRTPSTSSSLARVVPSGLYVMRINGEEEDVYQRKRNLENKQEQNVAVTLSAIYKEGAEIWEKLNISRSRYLQKSLLEVGATLFTDPEKKVQKSKWGGKRSSRKTRKGRKSRKSRKSRKVL